MNASDAAISRVLRTRLAGRSTEPFELSGADWEAVRSRMFNGNVPGLLAAAVEDGEILLERQERDRLHERVMLRLVNDLRAEDESVRVTELLGGEGIETLVLKGLAVAHLDYPDPSQRSTTDVDLLVRSTDITRAAHVLTGAGYRRELPERRPGFDRRFAKDVTFYGPRGVEVDLHRTLLLGPFGAAIDLEELWSGRQLLDVSGLPERWALDVPSRLMHASYTVAVSDTPPTLASLCDVILLAQDPAMDWAALRRRARRWRATGIVVDAVGAAAQVAGLDLRVPFEDSRDGVERRWRSLYESGGGSLVATTIGVSRALRPRETVRYARDLVWPVRSYRRARRTAGRRSERGAAIDAIRERYGRHPS